MYNILEDGDYVLVDTSPAHYNLAIPFKVKRQSVKESFAPGKTVLWSFQNSNITTGVKLKKDIPLTGNLYEKVNREVEAYFKMAPVAFVYNSGIYAFKKYTEETSILLLCQKIAECTGGTDNNSGDYLIVRMEPKFEELDIVQKIVDRLNRKIP